MIEIKGADEKLIKYMKQTICWMNVKSKKAVCKDVNDENQDCEKCFKKHVKFIKGVKGERKDNG